MNKKKTRLINAYIHVPLYIYLCIHVYIIINLFFLKFEYQLNQNIQYSYVYFLVVFVTYHPMVLLKQLLLKVGNIKVYICELHTVLPFKAYFKTLMQSVPSKVASLNKYDLYKYFTSSIRSQSILSFFWKHYM